MPCSDPNETFGLHKHRPVVCLVHRSAVLDPARSDGQETLGHSGCQHRQVPLCCVRQPNANHPLAEEWQRVQGGTADGRHQGKRTRRLKVRGGRP